MESEDAPEDLSLIVSERPIEFTVDATHALNPRAMVRRLRFDDLDVTYRQVVIAYLGGLTSDAEQKAVLVAAREMLIGCAELRERERVKTREKSQ